MAKPSPPPGVKKQYSPPVLTIYGTVRELTKVIGNKGNKDGGHAPVNRTGIK